LTFLTQRFRPSVGPFDAPVAWWARISVRQPEPDPNKRAVSGETALSIPPDDEY
jgi:hypothetical protein